MKTIIAAIDFSENSNNAAFYAADLALALGTKLTLCHVCIPPVVISEVPVPGTSIEDLLSFANKELNLLKEKILLKTGDRIQVFLEIRQGSVITEINDYADLVKPYAVVMGSEKESKLDRVLLGGVTFSALTNLEWPVIIVPSGTRFTIIRKVALACDLINVEETIPLQQIKDFVNHFSAELHVLHVDPEGHKSSDALTIELSYLKDILRDLHPIYHFFEGDDIEKIITAFLDAEAVDLLFVIPKKYNLFQKLFHRSHTKKLVLQVHTPMMTVHE